MSPAAEPQRPSWLLIGTTLGWALLFTYLLLTSDPPNVGPIRLRRFEDQGHLFGSGLLGALLFLVTSRWPMRAARAAGVALLISFGFLTALELLQEARPGRGYQPLDVRLNLVGAAAGVALAWVTDRIAGRRRRSAPDATETPREGAQGRTDS